MLREIIKYVEPGKATMNLINYASALTEYVDSLNNIVLSAKKLLWIFLHNLKENRKYVEGKKPPKFDGCERGEAFAKFQM